jgi:Reverse transcriptase (RNA-dependent DNA polymerase)
MTFTKLTQSYASTPWLVEAFDSVIHDLICSKLSLNFRFHSTAVALIKSYLSHRHQCFYVGGDISSFAPILKGFIQGSILGLVLFSFFINDQLEVIMFSQAHLYVDDVQTYVSRNLFDAARVIKKLGTGHNSTVSLFQTFFQSF